MPAQAPLPPPPPRCCTAPPPPLPTLTPQPPYCLRCHRRHASPTLLPSCHCRRKAVAATATTAIALSRRCHRCRRRALDASQLLLPSCCRRHHHRAKPAPQRFRRRCQAAINAKVTSTIAARCPHPPLPPPPWCCHRHTATTAAKLPLPPRHCQAATFKLPPLPLPWRRRQRRTRHHRQH